MSLVKECSDSEGFYFPAVIFNSEDVEVYQNDLLLLSKEKVIKYLFAGSMTILVHKIKRPLWKG